MIDNKKYLKDVSSMYATAQRVKKYVVAELDKIDEKYRKIIAEEKKKLNEQLEVLNAQIKFYAGIVSPEETPAPEESEPKEEQAPAVEEEPVITDTIFPENNEPEEIAEPAPVAEDAGEPAGVPVDSKPASDEQSSDGALAKTAVDLDAEEDDEWNQRIESGELKEVAFEESNTETEGDPSQWPEYQEKQKPAVQETADDWSDVQWN